MGMSIRFPELGVRHDASIDQAWIRTWSIVSERIDEEGSVELKVVFQVRVLEIPGVDLHAIACFSVDENGWKTPSYMVSPRIPDFLQPFVFSLIAKTSPLDTWLKTKKGSENALGR